RSFEAFSPVPAAAGLILLCAYFAGNFSTSLPFIPARRVFRIGFILHYGVLPAALALIYLFNTPSSYYDSLSAFGFCLVGGLAFALLSFRMYELRQIFSRDP